MNHTRFPKEDHLPEWTRWDSQVKKCDRVEYLFSGLPWATLIYSVVRKFPIVTEL